MYTIVHRPERIDKRLASKYCNKLFNVGQVKNIYVPHTVGHCPLIIIRSIMNTAYIIKTYRLAWFLTACHTCLFVTLFGSKNNKIIILVNASINLSIYFTWWALFRTSDSVLFEERHILTSSVNWYETRMSILQWITIHWRIIIEFILIN